MYLPLWDDPCEEQLAVLLILKGTRLKIPEPNGDVTFSASETNSSTYNNQHLFIIMVTRKDSENIAQLLTNNHCANRSSYCCRGQHSIAETSDDGKRDLPRTKYIRLTK